MNAEIYTSNLYWNESLSNFFLGSQATEQLTELAKISNNSEEMFNRLDDIFSDVDDLSNTLAYENEETIIDLIGKDLFNL